MKKRKIFTCFLIILLLLNLFVSCNRPEGYVKYPKNYTLEYCQANYEDADQQLVAIEIAPNCIDPDQLYGAMAHQPYYAIKDVPFDEYLNCVTFYFFGGRSDRLVRKKQENAKPDFLTLEYESIELYWGNTGESIVIVSGYGATSLREHFNDCIENHNYLPDATKLKFISKEAIHVDSSGREYTSSHYLYVRIHFAKYEYIAFEAKVKRSESDNRYYMQYQRENDWIYIPLPEDLAKLIPET